MKHTCLLLLVFVTTIGYTQQYKDPEKLVTDFVTNQVKTRTKVLTGEAYEQQLSPQLFEDTSIQSVTTIKNTKKELVQAVTIKYPSDELQDVYIFTAKQKGSWYISNIRALWMPPFFLQMLEAYRGKTKADLEAYYEGGFSEMKAKNDTLTRAYFEEVNGTLPEFIYEVENMKLTIATDAQLIAHFKKYESDFNSLNNSLEEVDKESLKHKYQHLLISNITKFENIKYFIIYRLTDNEVGYLYCANPKELPEITAESYIMIKEIGNGWYIYKTT